MLTTLPRAMLLNTVFPAELLPPRSVSASQVPSLVALIIASVAAAFLGSASPVAIPVVPMTWILLNMFLIGLDIFPGRPRHSRPATGNQHRQHVDDGSEPDGIYARHGATCLENS
jgi:hypothetical protein